MASSNSMDKFKALGNRYRFGYRYGVNTNTSSSGGGGGGSGTDEIPLPDGSAAAPSLNFENALSSGMYLKQVSPPILGVASNGTESATLTPGAVI